jgi:hypothetical protein
MHKYAVNLPCTDDFDFSYVSFGINLDAPPDRPSIQKALVKCLPGVRSGDGLRKHAPARHRLPLPVGRSTSKRIAIKECSPAELLDDPVVGLVTMSDGADRQTIELLA